MRLFGMAIFVKPLSWASWRERWGWGEEGWLGIIPEVCHQLLFFFLIHMHSCFPRMNPWLHVPMETRCQVSLPLLGYGLPHFSVFPCWSLCKCRSGDWHSQHTFTCHLGWLSLGLLPAALFWSWALRMTPRPSLLPGSGLSCSFHLSLYPESI